GTAAAPISPSDHAAKRVHARFDPLRKAQLPPLPVVNLLLHGVFRCEPDPLYVMMVKIGRGSLGKESESRAGNGCHATESDRSGGPQIAVWEQMARRLTALSGALFVLLVLIAPVGAAESGESGSQSAYAFSLEAYAGRTLAYRL